MQHDSDGIPAVPRWFNQSLGLMLASYPSVTPSQLLPVAYWARLYDLPQEAVSRAFDRAMSASPQFIPSAPMVREHALVAAKSIGNRPNMELKALPEPEGQLDPVMAERFAELRARFSGKDLAREMAKAVLGKLGE